MRRLLSPRFENGRHPVPKHQTTFGQVVLVHLFGVDGRGQYFSLALHQANQRILDHCPPDAAGCDWRPETPVSTGRHRHH